MVTNFVQKYQHFKILIYRVFQQVFPRLLRTRSQRKFFIKLHNSLGYVRLEFLYFTFENDGH